jgi:Flp pilus assembly protein TadD
LPRPPAPSDDPREEYNRQLLLGREAFRAQEYGRAAQRFRQASRLEPDEAMPHFLLVQAFLAQGKYHDAMNSIRAGMRRNPDWPRARFRPIELYGDQVTEYPLHLRTLEEALQRHPGDPLLLFLHGYQLWFDGRRDEARPLFLRALPRSADRDLIERFRRALPPAAL